MGKRYPVGMESILLAINIPIRRRVTSADNPIPIEIKEWVVIPQFACWKKITPGLSVGHSEEHTAITGKVNASTPINISMGDEYFGLAKFIYRFCLSFGFYTLWLFGVLGASFPSSKSGLTGIKEIRHKNPTIQISPDKKAPQMLPWKRHK